MNTWNDCSEVGGKTCKGDCSLVFNILSTPQGHCRMIKHGHKQIYISKFSCVNLFSSQTYKIISYINVNKTYEHKRQTFKDLAPFNIAFVYNPPKRAHKARTCWYCQPLQPIYQHQIKENIFLTKQWIKIKLYIYKCIMTNTSAIWQQAAHTVCHHHLAWNHMPVCAVSLLWGREQCYIKAMNNNNSC